MHWTHSLDPVLFSLGFVKVHWYGVMYVVGFVLGGWIAKKLIQKKFFTVPREKVDSLITILLICMFIGARMVYIFVYNWSYYSKNIGEIFFIWEGGLSFHGALIGLLVGGYIFAKRNNISWFQVMDVVALAGTPGIFFGRMGNFINGELFGRRTDAWVGIIFPSGGPYPRHPSQIYEGVMEGIVLSIILWFFMKRVPYYGYLGGFFIIGYAFFRFIIEFFREPDGQLGFLLFGMSMGQILCFLMAIGGFVYLFYARRLQLSIKR